MPYRTRQAPFTQAPFLSLLSAFVATLSMGFTGCQTGGGIGPSSQGADASTSSTFPPAAEVKIPDDAGLLWFPLSWTVRIEATDNEKNGRPALGTPVDSLQLRNLVLVVRNQKTKATTLLRLPLLSNEKGDGGSRAVLDASKPAATFALPLFPVVPEGEYVVEALQATYVDPASERTSDLQFPLENPFQMPSGRPALPVQLRKGFIAALPRMAAVTTFAMKDGGLVSLTEVENIDKEVVPVEFILDAGKLSAVASSRVYAASPDFPRARVSLLNASGMPTPPEPALAKVGLLVDIPCGTKGALNLVWKRVGDDRDYFSAIGIPEAGACEGVRTVPATLQLPKGEWMLRSTHVVTGGASRVPWRLDVLKAPTPALERYFVLGKRSDAYASVGLEKELKRQMVVRLAEPRPGTTLGFDGGSGAVYVGRTPPPDDALLFLGRFELVPVEAARAEVWDTIFKRTFALDEVRRAFGAQAIFNAYTSRRLTKGREKGTVQGVLRVASSQSDAKKLEAATSEFRKGATEMVASCITLREEVDPLVLVEGTGVFHGLKGGNGVTIKELKVSDDGESAVAVKNCMQKKLLDFRFARKLPASFQAEFKYISE
ncbi:MAG: hypothetical protein IOD12_06640 [Silvanigrellales bacterium]|nr:hypothetical protein [Silvanigrellales bacterium]